MHLPELWKGCTLIWEAVIINNVPVKDVHFVCFHGIECLQYSRQWNEVAWSVQKQTTMWVTWKIHDGGTVHLQLKWLLQSLSNSTLWNHRYSYSYNTVITVLLSILDSAFWSSNPAGLIFYYLRFETPSTLRTKSQYLYSLRNRVA